MTTSQIVLNPILKKAEILSIKDLDERNRQIAIFACDHGFNELTPTPAPLPPNVLVDYRRMSYGERRKIGVDFWLRDDIKIFLDKKWEANLQNVRNWDWLNTIKKWLKPETDTDYLFMVKQRIYAYAKFFEEEKERPFEVLKPIFK